PAERPDPRRSRALTRQRGAGLLAELLVEHIVSAERRVVGALQGEQACPAAKGAGPSLERFAATVLSHERGRAGGKRGSARGLGEGARSGFTQAAWEEIRRAYG